MYKVSIKDIPSCCTREFKSPCNLTPLYSYTDIKQALSAVCMKRESSWLLSIPVQKCEFVHLHLEIDISQYHLNGPSIKLPE